MSEQVNPFYLLGTGCQRTTKVFFGVGWVTDSKHSENCTGGTDGWYARKGEVPTEDVALRPFISTVNDSNREDIPENASGDVGDEESRGSHFPFDLQTENLRRQKTDHPKIETHLPSSHDLRQHIEKEMDDTSV